MLIIRAIICHTKPHDHPEPCFRSLPSVTPVARHVWLPPGPLTPLSGAKGSSGYAPWHPLSSRLCSLYSAPPTLHFARFPCSSSASLAQCPRAPALGFWEPIHSAHPCSWWSSRLLDGTPHSGECSWRRKKWPVLKRPSAI